jgi:hypothetical protein
VNVLNYEDVTVPLGTFKAYKVQRVITIPLLGGTVENLTRWFVPYVGVVKYVYNIGIGDVDTEVLTSMKVNRSSADFNNDLKTDIVWRNKSTGENAIWLMDRLLWTSTAFLPAQSDTGWEIVGP